MRVGSNPEKDQPIASRGYHRIIIPVYIPHFQDYFVHGLEITRMCLESVIKTKHPQCLLTVVNNGSCQEVTNYLQKLYQEGQIDQLVHHSQNVGKIDAVIPLARSAAEPLITISDGDVLFLDGWAQAVEEVYEKFPKAGMVSPVPHGTTYNSFTQNTLFDGFFGGRLRFQQCCDPEAMMRFAESIGKEDSMYQKKIRLKYQLTVKREEFSAVVGCGHFVSTLRKEVFDYAPKNHSHWAYASEADRNYIDIPNEKAGFWRLATTVNCAYHMGNIPQDWMRTAFKELKGGNTATTIPSKPRSNAFDLSFKKAFNRLWMNRWVRPLIFGLLGLKEDRNQY